MHVIEKVCITKVRNYMKNMIVTVLT